MLIAVLQSVGLGALTASPALEVRPAALGSTPISFEAPGEPLAVIVERLAEVTGSALTTGAEERGHYLTISVTDMPLEDLLDGIARVTVMNWIPDRGGLRLVPDNARRSEIEAELAAERAALFKFQFEEWIRVQRKALEEMGEFNPRAEGGAENVYMHHYMGLYVDVFETLLPYVDMDRVGRLRPGERVVFATDPTRMQVPMVGVPNSVFNRLTEIQRSFSSNARVAPSPPSARDLYRISPNAETVVNKIAIGIKRDPRGSGNSPAYNVDFTLFERRDGRNLQVQRGSEDLPRIEDLTAEGNADPIGSLESLGLEPVENIRYGDIVMASLESPENTTMRRRFSEHSEAIQKIALNLQEHDPQIEIVAPYLLQVTERNNLQVIANVADRSAYSLLVRAAGTNPLYPNILIAHSHELEVADGTLYVRPIDVPRAVADRVDREYVSEYISRFRGHRQIPLIAQLEYFRTTEGLIDDTGTLVNRFVLSSTAHNDNFYALRLLSRATTAEVDWLLSNVVIPYQQLSAPLRQAFHEMIFNHELGVSLDEREQAEDLDEYIMTHSRFQEIGGYEVTEVFANGIPNETHLRVRAGETWMFVNEIERSSATMHVNILQDIFNYARNRAFLDNAPPTTTSNFVRIDYYYVERARFYGFQLQFGPHFRSSFQATDLEIGPHARAHHFTEFPPEIADQVSRATERMRNDPRFQYIFDPNIFGGQRPP